jgi:hypothetical protein
MAEADAPLTKRGSGSPAGELRRPITLRLPNETLAALQLASAAIRRSSGSVLGFSAIVRALIGWLAETDIDTLRIRSPQDLRARLLSRVRGANARAARAGESEFPAAAPLESTKDEAPFGRGRRTESG